MIEFLCCSSLHDRPDDTIASGVYYLTIILPYDSTITDHVSKFGFTKIMRTQTHVLMEALGLQTCALTPGITDVWHHTGVMCFSSTGQCQWLDRYLIAVGW